jgi:hypothetical protein
MNINNATFSPESEAGHTPFNSQVCQMDLLAGLDHAHANRFRAQDSEREKLMSGTCGQSGSVSLRSANLQSSLENRLRARMDVNGSPEYSLTWKHWAMPSREPICALRASAHPMYGKEFIGYPTPRASDRGPRNPETAKRKLKTDGRTKHHRIEDLLTALATNIGYPNPVFLFWMMGFPEFWIRYAQQAMQSCRKSRRNLSERSLKRKDCVE